MPLDYRPKPTRTNTRARGELQLDTQQSTCHGCGAVSPFARGALSEHQAHLDLADSRRVRLRAHPAEVGVRDVGLDPSEHDRVEHVEHVGAEPELYLGNPEIPADAEVLVE